MDTIEGTTGDDTIEAVASSLSSGRTLDAGDQIDGGEGADTLNVDVQGNFTGFSGDGFLKNVETVNLTNEGTIERSFAAKEVTGVETYNLTGAVDLSDLAATDAAINLIDRATGDTSIGFAAEVADGAADALALGLENVGTVKTADAAEAAVTVTVADIEELNITAAGANVVDLNAVDLTEVTVAGAGSLAITGTASELKTVDAGSLEGDLRLDADLNGDLALNATIAGGAGDDRLVLTNTGAAATVQFAMSGVQTVELGDLGTNDLTFSATNVSDLEKVVVGADADGDAVFANVGAQDLAIDLSGNGNTITVSADHSGSSTVTAKAAATADKDNITVSDTDLVLANTSGAILNVDKFADYTGTLTAAKAQSLEATVDGAVNGSVALAAATAIEVTQTNKDVTSALTVDAAKAVDMNVTAAGDFGVTVTDLGALESLTVDSGKAFSIGNLVAINNVTLSGATADSAATIGNLGVNTLDYGITVTAEGLKAGLSVGTVDTGAGNAVSIDASAVTGDVTVGDVAVAADATTSAATGSITVDVNGTAGDVVLGALQAKTVTVDASGALGTVSDGNGTAATDAVDIVADTATFTGSTLKQNIVDVTAAVAATVTGGIQDDFITVTTAEVAGKTSTVSLTGGLGADTFDITFAATTPGASKVTITDFNTDDDTLTLAATYELVAKDDTAAAGSLEKALAGNSLTAVLEAAYDYVDQTAPASEGADIAFVFGSNTYLVSTVTNVDGLGNGEHLITLTGVQLDATSAFITDVA